MPLPLKNSLERRTARVHGVVDQKRRSCAARVIEVRPIGFSVAAANRKRVDISASKKFGRIPAHDGSLRTLNGGAYGACRHRLDINEKPARCTSKPRRLKLRQDRRHRSLV